MPTAQARTTRARGLHATRSRIRSDNGTSSLPERRIECRFVLFRWHRANTCHALKCQVCDLCGPMALFPGAYDLRALSWVYGRVWGAAGRGCHTPAWPGSAHFVRSSYVNRALFGISTADEAQRCRTLLARAKAPKRPASTTQLACASGCPWPGRRDRVLGAAANLKLLQLGARQQKALRLGMRSSLPSRLNLACPAQATGQAPLTASHSTADWVHSHRTMTVTLCEHNINLKGISTHQRRVLYRRIVDPDPKLNGTG